MNRRKFLRSAAGLLVPAATLMPLRSALGQVWPNPGPGRAAAGGGGTTYYDVSINTNNDWAQQTTFGSDPWTSPALAAAPTAGDEILLHGYFSGAASAGTVSDTIGDTGGGSWTANAANGTLIGTIGGVNFYFYSWHRSIGTGGSAGTISVVTGGHNAAFEYVELAKTGGTISYDGSATFATGSTSNAVGTLPTLSSTGKDLVISMALMATSYPGDNGVYSGVGAMSCDGEFGKVEFLVTAPTTPNPSWTNSAQGWGLVNIALKASS